MWISRNIYQTLEEHASNVWGTWRKYLNETTFFTRVCSVWKPSRPGLNFLMWVTRNIYQTLEEHASNVWGIRLKYPKNTKFFTPSMQCMLTQYTCDGLLLNVSFKKHLSNAWGTRIKCLGNRAEIPQWNHILYPCMQCIMCMKTQ
jgi:hypothetical protein